MCGRYSFAASKEKVKAQFDQVEVGDNLTINFNIAPTQAAYVISNDKPGQLQEMHWGLVPHWSKDGKKSGRMINARAETVATKPSFRTPFKKRRCLVLADSFYEWKREDQQKIPYRIFPHNEELLVMAGIWDHWTDGQNELYTFSILTTAPNEEMASVHDRMPVVLYDAVQYQQWLDPAELNDLNPLMETPPNGILKMYPVSTEVNSVRNNGPHLHQQFLPPPTLFDMD